MNEHALICMGFIFCMLVHIHDCSSKVQRKVIFTLLYFFIGVKIKYTSGINTRPVWALRWC